MTKTPHVSILQYLYENAAARFLNGQTKHLSASQEGMVVPRSSTLLGNTMTKKTIRKTHLYTNPDKLRDTVSRDRFNRV